MTPTWRAILGGILMFGWGTVVGMQIKINQFKKKL